MSKGRRRDCGSRTCRTGINTRAEDDAPETGSSTEELQDEAGTSQERSAEELRKSFRKSQGSFKEAPRKLQGEAEEEHGGDKEELDCICSASDSDFK